MKRHFALMLPVALISLGCCLLQGAGAQENNALVPGPKLENDWYARHKE